MNAKARQEDLKQVKEYLRMLSDLSKNMSLSIQLPKKQHKGFEEKMDAIVTQAVSISESFMLMETLLQDLGMIKQPIEKGGKNG